MTIPCRPTIGVRSALSFAHSLAEFQEQVEIILDNSHIARLRKLTRKHAKKSSSLPTNLPMQTHKHVQRAVYHWWHRGQNLRDDLDTMRCDELLRAMVGCGDGVDLEQVEALWIRSYGRVYRTSRDTNDADRAGEPASALLAEQIHAIGNLLRLATADVPDLIDLSNPGVRRITMADLATVENVA